MATTNAFGQPIGEELGDWRPPSSPEHVERIGDQVSLVPLSTDHADALYAAFSESDDSMWTYLPWGPFGTIEEVADNIVLQQSLAGWQSYALLVNGEALGEMSYLRIKPSEGSIEIGGIAYSPRLQQTAASTEAAFLLIDAGFSLGYRRVEWKCDHLNEPSRRAALRFGFQFEGIFRKATHYKGRSRDTAWFAITEDDWPPLRSAFKQWLAADNFVDGVQQRRLVELRDTST